MRWLEARSDDGVLAAWLLLQEAVRVGEAVPESGGVGPASVGGPIDPARSIDAGAPARAVRAPRALDAQRRRAPRGPRQRHPLDPAAARSRRHRAAVRAPAPARLPAEPTYSPPYALPERQVDYLLFRLPAGWQAGYRVAGERWGSDHSPLQGWIAAKADR